MSVQEAVQGAVQAPRTDQWLPDPSGRHQLRWWGGGRWTDAIADGATTGTDPLAAPPLTVAPAVRRPVIGSTLAAVGALGAVIGAFLPWATISGLADGAISGTEDGRDGVITLILAIVVLLLGAVMVGARSRVASVFAAIAGGLIALIAAYDASNVSSTANPYGDIVQISVGSGLWLTLVAGISIVIGGVIGVARR